MKNVLISKGRKKLDRMVTAKILLIYPFKMLIPQRLEYVRVFFREFHRFPGDLFMQPSNQLRHFDELY